MALEVEVFLYVITMCSCVEVYFYMLFTMVLEVGVHFDTLFTMLLVSRSIFTHYLRWCWRSGSILTRYLRYILRSDGLAAVWGSGYWFAVLLLALGCFSCRRDVNKMYFRRYLCGFDTLRFIFVVIYEVFCTSIYIVYVIYKVFCTPTSILYVIYAVWQPRGGVILQRVKGMLRQP